MTEQEKDTLRMIAENDIKFIRLAFCDIFGQPKNIAVTAEQFARAVEKGQRLDLTKYNSSYTALENEVILRPDVETMTVLPWRPQQGRVVRFFCDIDTRGGKPFDGDTRAVLKRTVEKYRKTGYDVIIGTECEFYLFKTDGQGQPTTVPLDDGGYLDVSPLDKGENIRREACLALEDMGISPTASYHECGPGQNEIVFRYSDALSAADHSLTYKYVVKSISALNGLFASFLPKPLDDTRGSGMHIKMTLKKNGRDVPSGSEEANCFMSGILNRIKEITLFLNPIENSYRRFGVFEAPKSVTWSDRIEGQLMYLSSKEDERMRIKLRSPDSALNPYLAFSLLIAAGVEGIENGLSLPAKMLKNAPELPRSLEEAIECAKSGTFARSVIGDGVFDAFIAAKEKECGRIKETGDRDPTFDRYFRSV